MLIRSQDKEQLFNANHMKVISICEKGKGYAVYVDCLYSIGDYSSKEKVIKVLDMIQEAYMDYKSGEIISNGLAGTAYTGSYDTKESVAHGIAVLKGYGDVVRKSILFQMPDDSEVKV